MNSDGSRSLAHGCDPSIVILPRCPLPHNTDGSWRIHSGRSRLGSSNVNRFPNGSDQSKPILGKLFVNVTSSSTQSQTVQTFPKSTPFIRTFRTPSPLLIYQLALIPGAILLGFLLSPFLVLSRNLAQIPTRRLRGHPKQHQKELQRRLLAVVVYMGAALCVFFVIGSWTRAMLNAGNGPKDKSRDPWIWVLLWMVEGDAPLINTSPTDSKGLIQFLKKWKRLLLMGYWAICVVALVGVWQRQLFKRHYRSLPQSSSAMFSLTNGVYPLSATSNLAASPSSAAQRLPSPTVTSNRSLHIEGPRDSGLDVNDAGDASSLPVVGVAGRRAGVTNNGFGKLGLNGRRKSFHALAVVMFAPGIIIDVRS